MDASRQTKAIRVAVRVRPLLPSDGATGHSLLQINTSRPNEVVLASDNDRRTARRYTFDKVFGPDVTQDELYDRVGVTEMVASVLEGYHSTIFAYGQTGSGKTYTMEGYRYVSPTYATAKPAVGSAGGRGGAARGASGITAAATPHADFSATPDEQLGLTTRAVRELFAAVARDRSRRFQIRCAFVQIYREQVYDLLNPGTLAGWPGSGGGVGPRRPGGGGGGGSAGGALRMRWSQQEGFYLDNLSMPEVESADEAIATFQAGVANKVMSSHRLNAASSRSHCIFTLHVTSSPLESPLEQRTAKLTLVDLAGSERAAHTGATEGPLRDESVAINKSLFTLRQVITALTDSTTATSTAAHVPYRDSKLTCLLKHSLGGSSLTLMVACLSPADRFLEENTSTLDYAARARRITNQLAVNEDPRSRLIRELRAEVTFLRQQLEAAGAMVPPMPLAGAAAGVLDSAATSKLAAPRKMDGNSEGGASAAGSASPSSAAAVMDTRGGGAFDSEEEAAYANQLRSSDVEVLVRAVIEASRVAVASSTALTGLRAAYARTSASLESLRVEYDILSSEDARLRDRLSLLEMLVAADCRGAAAISRPVESLLEADGGGSEAVGGLYTASTAALIELEELRRENALLHERLQLWEPDVGPSGVVLSTTRGSMATMGAQPVTAPGWSGGSNTLGVPARSAPARGGSGVRPATSGSGGVVRPGSSARGTGMTGSSSRRQQAQRAQSAGALLPTGLLGTSPGAAGAAAIAVAAAASNPFIPNEVLSAVLPPPPQPVGSGNATRGNRHANSIRPQASTSVGRSNTSKTLTVDQLRSVLQCNIGPDEGGGASQGAAAAPTGAAEEVVIHTDSNDIDAAAAPAARNAAVALSHRPTTDTGRLAELGHAVASRALTSGVRLSTTGKLLPAAPARMAVEAAATGGASLPMKLGAGSSCNTLTGAYRDLPALPRSGTEVATGPPLTGNASPDATLVQLLAERNALTRQRLAGGQ